METLKERKLSFPAMQILKAVAALGMILGLAGCPGGGGGGGGPAPVDPYAIGCGSCGLMNPTTLAVFGAQNADRNVVFSNMEIVGDANYIIPNASGSHFRNYEGPVSIRGQMTVQRPVRDPYSGCQLQAGTYHVQSLEAGAMYYAGGDITARLSSGAVEIVISNGILANFGKSLAANIGISRVAGQNCSNSFMDSFY